MIILLDNKHIASALLVYSMKRNFPPLLWGALTTAFGFILLRFSPSPPIQDFGAMVAFAVLVSFLSNYTILVAFARFAEYKPTITTANSYINKFYEHLSQLSWHIRRPMLFMIRLLSLVTAYSLPQLRFDDDAANYFPANNPFSMSNKKMEQKFNGVNQLSFIVDSNEPSPGRIINDAKLLGNLGSATIWVSLARLVNSGRLTTGDKVLILGAEATKYLYGGFVYTH